MGKKKLSDIQIEDIFYKKSIPYVIFVVVIAFLHIFGYEYYGDDAAMVLFLHDSIWEEITAIPDILSGWSARYMINPPIHVMFHFDYKVWLVLDVMLFLGIFKAMQKLTVNGAKVPQIYMMMSLLLMLPFLDYAEIGWVVTTMTYVWVAAAGFVACFTIKKMYDGETVRWYMYVPYLFLTLYASNKEEVSVMFTIIFAVASVYSIKNKKVSILVILQFAISLFNMLIHMFSDANQNRYEVRSTQANIMETSFFDKIIIGVFATLKHLFFEFNYVMFIFIIVLAVVVWIKCKKLVPRICSILPLTLLFFLDLISNDNEYMSISIDANEYITIVLGVIAVLCIFTCILYLYGTSDRGIMIITMLTAAFAGRVVVGFANSGWQTYERTYTFLYFVLIMAAAILACDVWEKLKYRQKQVLFGVVIVAGQIGVVKNILDIGIL